MICVVFAISKVSIIRHCSWVIYYHLLNGVDCAVLDKYYSWTRITKLWQLTVFRYYIYLPDS